MSMQDLPVGRRRDDHPEMIQPSGVSTAPPWDSVLDRLAKLERSHADLARFVASIHEALPAEIAAATGRTLALGSPIDAMRQPAPHLTAPPPPILGTPPPPLLERAEPPVSGLDPYTQTYHAPDPWAAPSAGESFFQPLEPGGLPFPTGAAEQPKRRLFRGRKAAREAQARIAAEFSAPPPPPGFFSHEPHLGSPAAPSQPPAGFGVDNRAPDFGLPPGWGPAGEASPPPMPEAAPAPPAGFASDFPNSGFAAPPGWFGSASESPSAAPPPPAGFASDFAESNPMTETGAGQSDRLSWGSNDLTSPSDFEFDPPTAMVTPAGFEQPHPGLHAVPPPPPGFGEDAPGLSAVPPPPPGFGPGEQYPGLAAVPPPPPGFGADGPGLSAVPPPPPPGFGPGEQYPGLAAVPPPPPGFGEDAPGLSAVPPPPPPGFGSGGGDAPPPPPGFGSMHTSEAFGYAQELTALVQPEVPASQPEEDEDAGFLAGTGTDRTSYSAVPPITPDFFARSSGKKNR
jgi:hypothetical protein